MNEELMKQVAARLTVGALERASGFLANRTRVWFALFAVTWFACALVLGSCGGSDSTAPPDLGRAIPDLRTASRDMAMAPRDSLASETPSPRREVT